MFQAINKFAYLFLIFVVFSCQAPTENQDPSESEGTVELSHSTSIGFAHNVYLWLKEDMTPQEIQEMESALDDLGRCPTIVAFYWGKPAGTPREIVDNSYDYAINAFFEDKEGHDAYQIDPIHEEFRQRAGGYFDKVQIYDNVIHN